MPQIVIPIFAEGVVHINSGLAYQKKDGRVYYFNGHEMPVFSHDENDMRSFKMIISQFYVNGNAKQSEIVRTFGIPPISLKRAVKLFRKYGPSGFYISLHPTRKPRVLISEIVSEAQKLLDEGKNEQFISTQLKLKKDTLQKAIRDGRLKKKTFSQK
jgi:transposase-like protein